MSDNSKKIDSILNHKSSIKSKHVSVEGANDFSFVPPSISQKKERKTSTQRLDVKTLERLKILYFFLPRTSDNAHATFDDILKSLIDDYVASSMSERQKEMFRQMSDRL